MIGNYRLHRLREIQAEELSYELTRRDLTPAMVTAIMRATIDACTDAYWHHDFEMGDRFAELNGAADNYFGSTKAA